MLSGGSLFVSSLIAANAGNQVLLNSGTLATGNMVYSNGLNFVVGNGSSAATLQLTGGTQIFQTNLVIANAGTVTRHR